MQVAFTAWDYQVTFLELSAVIVALIGVALAIKGTRWAWPFYLASAILYAILFINVDLIASAWLQLVFIVAAAWGWFDWGSEGIVDPNAMKVRMRAIGALGLVVAWIALTPLLSWLGGVATWLDAFVFVGSVAAQILMVLGYLESWPMWLVVNAVGTYHYAHQNLWFTSGFYFVLFVMAIVGWRQWARMRAPAEAPRLDAATV